MGVSNFAFSFLRPSIEWPCPRYLSKAKAPVHLKQKRLRTSPNIRIRKPPPRSQRVHPHSISLGFESQDIPHFAVHSCAAVALPLCYAFAGFFSHVLLVENLSLPCLWNVAFCLPHCMCNQAALVVRLTHFFHCCAGLATLISGHVHEGGWEDTFLVQFEVSCM